MQLYIPKPFLQTESKRFNDFDALWNQMVSDCEGLGAEDIISWRLADIENAKTIRASLAAN